MENETMTTDTRYNGWTNYETWRVHLEIFDGWAALENADFTPEQIEELANDILEIGVNDSSTTLDFARAFISDVNWHEIAKHLNENREAA
tara:strand:- start:196 stop:465 length:270 start_codon:yes stop_codon:yes gene_type:complete